MANKMIENNLAHEWFKGILAKYSFSQEAYYRRCIDRYVKTLDFVSSQIDINSASSIAEVGPGLLLPTLKSNTPCMAVAYGLATDDLKAILTALDIPHVNWDLNDPLPKAAMEQHDIIFFLEVIEHLTRYPDEVIGDIATLLRPGGLLVLTTVNFLRLSNRVRMLTGRSPLINPFLRTPHGNHHIREFHQTEMVKYLELAGLQVLSSELWGLHKLNGLRRLVEVPELIFPSLRNYMGFIARKPSKDLVGVIVD